MEPDRRLANRHRHDLQAAALAGSLFALYALGACRTIYGGDSGELVAAVHTLGIPHPSGYPLYVLLGKLWTLAVPIGSVALRMSLFSAACAAAAAALLYRLGRRLGVSGVAALFAALLLAGGPSFWSQANIQRVYSLNALFLVLALTLAVAWQKSRGVWRLLASLFVAALGAANHTYMGVFLIALALWASLVDRRLLRRPALLVAGMAAVGLGLSPYLYLPLRSRADPRLDWGNPETPGAVIDVVLRRDAWQRAWIEAPGDLLVIVADYLRGLAEELWWLGAALAVIGLLAARRRRWPLLLLLSAMLGNLLAMALHGSRTDLFFWHRYYIPSYLVAALLAGLGLEMLRARWPRVASLALAIPMVMLVAGFPRFDRSRYRIAEDFSRSLLDSLAPGAHLSASDDNILFVLIYLNLVEGLRPDVDLILQGVGGADLPPLRFEPATDPLYFTHHPNWNIPGLEVVPVGLAFRVARSEGPLPEPVILKAELDGERDPAVPKDYLTENLIGHFHYMLGVTFERRDWLRAREEFARAQQAAPRNDVLFYNLGLIYRRNGLLELALASFERSRSINPRSIASHKPVRAADRIEEVRREQARLAPLAEELMAAELARGVEAGSAALHEILAAKLAERGEAAAARGHWLRAMEVRAAEGAAIESRLTE